MFVFLFEFVQVFVVVQVGAVLSLLFRLSVELLIEVFELLKPMLSGII
jgi:hypothetical protein